MPWMVIHCNSYLEGESCVESGGGRAQVLVPMGLSSLNRWAPTSWRGSSDGTCFVCILWTAAASCIQVLADRLGVLIVLLENRTISV